MPRSSEIMRIDKDIAKEIRRFKQRIKDDMGLDISDAEASKKWFDAKVEGDERLRRFLGFK